MEKEYYMRLDKELLAELLAERDKEENTDFPLNLKTGKLCKGWEDCTNPQMDCLNCPLRYPNGPRQWVTDYTEPVKTKFTSSQTNNLNV